MEYLVLAAIIVLLAVVFLLIKAYMLKPGKTTPLLEKMKEHKFAHRGLHGEEIAENSLSAFLAAKEAGFGIELDVRLAKDGVLVVHHDDTLKRSAGIDGKVIDYTSEELSNIKIFGKDEGVPTFRQVLDAIDGSVPLLIEIKHDLGEGGVAERLAVELEGYGGEYIVESFNPLALRKFRALNPHVPIGILSMKYMEEEKYKGKLLYWLLQNLYMNFLARPDFIAYEKNGHDVKNLRRIRKQYSTPLFAWVPKSEEEESAAISQGFDTVIFENYTPHG